VTAKWHIASIEDKQLEKIRQQPNIALMRRTPWLFSWMRVWSIEVRTTGVTRRLIASGYSGHARES